MDDHPRVRKKPDGIKVYYTNKRYNIFILSNEKRERKANTQKNIRETIN